MQKNKMVRIFTIGKVVRTIVYLDKIAIIGFILYGDFTVKGQGTHMLFSDITSTIIIHMSVAVKYPECKLLRHFFNHAQNKFSVSAGGPHSSTTYKHGLLGEENEDP